MANRPSWRLPMRPAVTWPEGIRGKRSQFGDGHPSRRQCVGMAKSTGERCRRDAMQGSKRCPSHGGYTEAYRNAPAGFISTRSGPSAVRTALFRLQLQEPFPPGIELPRSYVERGRIIERERNRALGLTSKHKREPT